MLLTPIYTMVQKDTPFASIAGCPLIPDNEHLSISNETPCLTF